jgi:hypothetical protein
VLSAAKVCCALSALVGLLLGGIMATVSALGVTIQAQGNGPQLPAIFLGVGALVFVVLVCGIFGFITGAIYVALYNVIAGMVGGLELEFERKATTPPLNNA